MVVPWLEISNNSPFPAVDSALEDGLLAAGGDLSPSRLINAYQCGIFPWFNRSDPILWWSPNPRLILFTDKIKISQSLKKTLGATSITITMDQDFTGVMTACAAPRQIKTDQIDSGTWIHPDMIESYTALHQQGFAHSIECWHDGNLIGGLYGVAIGKVFFGESMFSTLRDSSKIALVVLCQQLQRWGFPIIDCQIYSQHLASLGAEEIPRQDFINYLKQYCSDPLSQKQWQLDSDLPLVS
ncbi:MAG: leucyl/phenylalanyl-tRNA--protein transferase [Methylophagaceae bacterium]